MEHQANVILRGGGPLVPDEERIRYVADPTERLKLFLGNRYEHYQPTTARQRHSDGRELLVFKWVYRTYVAE
ncbi:DUF5988 family protein [Streptomyces sp. NPDC049744]|uniref:DUF5988 family protein n=1 Tax=Streptomyces sp. NPDC049744 TaxID=3154359 RepID=UPI00341A9F32